MSEAGEVWNRDFFILGYGGPNDLFGPAKESGKPVLTLGHAEVLHGAAPGLTGGVTLNKSDHRVEPGELNGFFRLCVVHELLLGLGQREPVDWQHGHDKKSLLHCLCSARSRLRDWGLRFERKMQQVSRHFVETVRLFSGTAVTKSVNMGASKSKHDMTNVVKCDASRCRLLQGYQLAWSSRDKVLRRPALHREMQRCGRCRFPRILRKAGMRHH